MPVFDGHSEQSAVKYCRYGREGLYECQGYGSGSAQTIASGVSGKLCCWSGDLCRSGMACRLYSGSDHAEQRHGEARHPSASIWERIARIAPIQQSKAADPDGWNILPQEANASDAGPDIHVGMKDSASSGSVPQRHPCPPSERTFSIGSQLSLSSFRSFWRCEGRIGVCCS